MEHRLRHPTRSTGPDRLRRPLAFGGGSPDDTNEEDGNVLVIWGATMEEMPVAGLSVEQVRQQYGTAYNIAPGADVTVNGVVASGDTRVRAGDNLEFVHASGEKGAIAWP